MSLTREWAKEAFCHIVTVVFQKPLDSSFVKVLEAEGYKDICSILTMSDEDIEALSPNCSTTLKDIPLSISDKHLLFIFRFFHLHRLLNGYSPMT